MSTTIFKRDGAKYANLPWCVRWDDYSSGEVKRRERGFVSEKAAKQFRVDVLRDIERGGVVLSPLEEAGVRLCRSAGRDLLEVVQAGLAGGVRVDPNKKIPSVEWAFESFIEDCDRRNLRQKTLVSYRSLIAPFVNSRKESLVSDLSAEDLRGYIMGRYTDEVSRQTARRTLSRFFGWCSERPRNWLPPFDKEDLQWAAAIKTAQRPVILTALEAGRFIQAVPDRLKAAVALGLFAGIRPEELRRMHWSWTDERGDWFGVDFARKTVELSGEWTKIRRARTLHDLPANLWAWLEKYKGDGLLVEVDERAWYRIISEARDEAGIIKTGSDMMRHSFGSYHRHRGLDATVDIMGHTGDLSVLNRYYNNNSISAEDADKYFAIVPGQG